MVEGSILRDYTRFVVKNLHRIFSITVFLFSHIAQVVAQII